MASLLEYTKVEGESAEYLEKYFTSESRSGYVQCEGFVLPEDFRNFGDQIRSMEVHPDDVWLCSVPKSGTTWAQEAVWCIANDVDLESAKKRLLMQRFPFLERTVFCGRGTRIKLPESFSDSVTFVEKLLSPRFIRTHLPLKLLPAKLVSNEAAKIVYIAKNPRDTCLAYYRATIKGGFQRELEMFCERFMDGAVPYLPYWDHFLPFWRLRKQPNMLFLTCEELEEDMKSGILRIAKFLGKQLSEKQVRDLTEHLSFENMERNPALNGVPESKFFSTLSAPPANKGRKDVCPTCGRAMGSETMTMSESMMKRFREWEKECIKDMRLTQ